MSCAVRKEVLLSRVGKLIRGKSVEKTLTRLHSGKPVSKWTELKGWSSLFTHVSIECEKGNIEFAELLKDLYAIIGEVMNG